MLVRTIYAHRHKIVTNGVDMVQNRSLRTSKPRHANAELCPVESALNQIGGKWKGLVILRLLVRVRRFNELLRTLEGCSQRMLTKQLRELEGDGIINRKVYAEVPPRVEYSLTAVGKDLEPVVRSMCEWGQKHVLKIEPNWIKIFESLD